MNSGEQAPLAPLTLLDPGREPAAQHEPLPFERRECHVHIAGVQTEARCQDGRRGRADNLEPPAHDLANGVLASPRLRPIAFRHRECRLDPDAGERRLDERHALRRDPECGRAAGPARPPLSDQGVEQWLPHGTNAFLFPFPLSPFLLRQTPRNQQCIVELISGTDLRPRFLPHPLDGRGVQGAQLIGRLHVERAAGGHGLGATLLQRCVVQEGVGASVQHLVRDRRGFGRVAGHQLEFALGQVLQHTLEP